MRIAFADFEATDKDPYTARITQWAVSLWDSDTRSELSFDSGLLYDSSYTSIHEEASRVTGITLEQLEEFGESPVDSLPRFIKLVNKSEYVVYHNGINFDIPLLKTQFASYALSTPNAKPIDTRFDIKYPGHIETRKLSYLAVEHGYFNAAAHSARHDVDAMAKLFFMYPIEETIVRANSPNIYIRADVNYGTRDKAKEKKYLWDGECKIWVKQIKEMDYESEVQTSQFAVLRLPDYTPPKK